MEGGRGKRGRGIGGACTAGRLLADPVRVVVNAVSYAEGESNKLRALLCIG